MNRNERIGYLAVEAKARLERGNTSPDGSWYYGAEWGLCWAIALELNHGRADGRVIPTPVQIIVVQDFLANKVTDIGLTRLPAGDVAALVDYYREAAR